MKNKIEKIKDKELYDPDNKKGQIVQLQEKINELIDYINKNEK